MSDIREAATADYASSAAYSAQNAVEKLAKRVAKLEEGRMNHVEMGTLELSLDSGGVSQLLTLGGGRMLVEDLAGLIPPGKCLPKGAKVVAAAY